MKFNSDGIKNNVIPNLENGIKSVDSVDIMAINNKLGEFDPNSKLYTYAKNLSDVADLMYVIVNKLDVSIELFDQAEKNNINTIEQLLLEEINYKDFVYVNEDGRYGVAQNALDSVVENGDTKTIRQVAEVCNMSYRTAAMYCMFLNSLGVCTYSSSTNVIVELYKDDPAQFKKDFGYPLYKVSREGNVVANGEVIMAEMFAYYNLDENGGNYLTRGKDGKIIFAPDALVEGEEWYNKSLWSPTTNQNFPKENEQVEWRYDNNSQIFVADRDKTDDSIMKFLEYKGASKSVKTTSRCTEDMINKSDKKNRKATLKNYLEEQTSVEGKHIVMIIYPSDHEIIIEDKTNNNKRKMSGSGHAAYVLGTDEKGVYYSTYGNVWFISYDELAECDEYEFEVYEKA